MARLLVLIGATFLAQGLGQIWSALGSWVEAARVGLAVMPMFIARAHFGSQRAGMM
jgi:hypothetical protein